MGPIRILSVIFLILLVIIRASDASPRILMAEEKPRSDKISPSPTPKSPPVNKELNQNDPSIPKTGDDRTKENNSPQNGKKDDGQKGSKDPPKNEEKKNDDKQKESNGPSKSPENGKKDDGSKKSGGPSKSKENGKKDEGKQGSKGPNGEGSQLLTCDGSVLKCQQQDLVACLQHSENAESKELVIVVQNAGDNTLNVNITVPTSISIDAKMLNLAQHGATKVNISAGATKNLTIILNAGKGDCAIPIGIGPSISDWIQQFPAYASQLNPMYGAYFVFFILVIAGGIWGYCKFRRRGRSADGGIPYQQLEMGAQGHSSTEIVEASTVDGWEQGWDDDWDEEATARPSTRSPNGNVLSNGLSSRSASKKNDWDIDWDD